MDHFLEYVRTNQIKPSSEKVLRSRWNKFLNWAIQNEIELDVVNQKILIEYANSMIGIKQSDRYVRLAAAVLNVHLDQDSVVDAPRPDPLKIGVPHFEALEILNEKRQINPSSLIWFTAWCAAQFGLKPAEIQQLNKKSLFNNDSGFILEVGKGLHKRYLSLTKAEFTQIKLFLETEGQSLTTQLKGATFWRHLKKELMPLGLGSSLQALRNSYILEKAQSSMPLHSIAREVGHTMPLSTIELVDRLRKANERQSESNNKSNTR